MMLNARRAALTGLATMVTAMAAGEASAVPTTHDCAKVTVGKGSAYGIRATGISCAKARTVVRACLRRQSLKGWRIATAPSPDDTDPKGLKVLDKGAAHLSFQVRGRRACA